MSLKDFLVELGTEELPPKALTGLAAAFLKGVEDRLQAEHIVYQSAKVFAAPRRLAILITDLQQRQEDIATEILGPPVKAAFDKEGNATKAAEGFARKCGVSVEQLEHMETDKGVKLAGLITTLQPAASAGAIFHAAWTSGPFQGTISAATPIGSRCV